MPTTFTSAAVAAGPLSRPGPNTVIGRWNGADQRPPVTLSTSLVLQMVAVPHGASIIDLWFYNQRAAAGGFTVGDSSLTNRYITSTSLAAGTLTRMNGGAGYTVSVSDDATQRFDTIDITFNGVPTPSATATIVLGVTYLVA